MRHFSKYRVLISVKLPALPTAIFIEFYIYIRHLRSTKLELTFFNMNVALLFEISHSQFLRRYQITIFKLSTLMQNKYLKSFTWLLSINFNMAFTSLKFFQSPLDINTRLPKLIFPQLLILILWTWYFFYYSIFGSGLTEFLACLKSMLPNTYFLISRMSPLLTFKI